MMKFIQVGHHYINLLNVNYVVRDGSNKIVVFFLNGHSPGVRAGYYLDLFGEDADEFERKLSKLCD